MRAAFLRITLTVLALGLVALWGCSDDETIQGLDSKGTVNVFPLPASQDFPWQLTGPDGYTHDGVGSETLEEMPAGTYEVTWTGISGWIVPGVNPLSKTVTGGANTTFSATYRQAGGEAQPGEIQINPTPEDLDAPWTLTGPEGFTESGNGAAILEGEEIVPGDYTIVWADIDGWETPPSQVQTLVEGEGLTFSAQYISEESSALHFVPVTAGSFFMGSANTTSGADPYEWPRHEVTLTRSFEISETEITWAQYEQLIGENPSFWDSICPGCETTLPVERVSWLKAVEFCNALSVEDGYAPSYTIVGEDVTWDQNAAGYRLPTEAEWEYACRAGTETSFANGELTYVPASCGFDANLSQIGWYCYNSSDTPRVTGSLDSNGWGIFDMHGNVWEWVWDHSDEYDKVLALLGDFYRANGDTVQLGNLSIMSALPGTGTAHMAWLQQVGATLSISNLGISTASVSFIYADFGDAVNFSVNNNTLYQGVFSDFPTDVAPGVTLAVTADPIDDDIFGVGVVGTVTLTGDVSSMRIGGENLLIDTFEITDAETGFYGLDRLVDFETLTLNLVFRPNPGGQLQPITLSCTVTDPLGPSVGTGHMLRGGGYANNANSCRSATRSLPSRGRYSGFRVVRTLD